MRRGEKAFSTQDSAVSERPRTVYCWRAFGDGLVAGIWLTVIVIEVVLLLARE